MVILKIITIKYFKLVLQLIFCMLLIVIINTANAECEKQKITQKELDELISLHQEWLDHVKEHHSQLDEIKKLDIKVSAEMKRKSDSSNVNNDKRRLNLCGKTIEKLTIRDADLTKAQFNDSVFFNTEITKSTLDETYFRDSTLIGLKILDSHKLDAHFLHSKITDLEINGSRDDAILVFISTNILRLYVLVDNIKVLNILDSTNKNRDPHKRYFVNASIMAQRADHIDFEGTSNIETQLSIKKIINANFRGFDFSRMRFEAEFDNVDGFVGSKNLHLVNRTEFKYAIPLRDKLRKQGLKPYANALNAAIYKMHRKDDDFSFSHIVDDYIQGGLLTHYAAKPFNAIWVLLIFIPIFAIIYIWFIVKPTNIHCIWQELDKDRVLKLPGENIVVTINHENIVKTIWVAVYFSILSAFHFGWRSLNLGNWLVKLQHREYVLKATGWARTISGIQSLISLYLIAIWALTYFGSPFE